jgi:hypothetical protein
MVILFKFKVPSSWKRWYKEIFFYMSAIENSQLGGKEPHGGIDRQFGLAV